MADTADMTYSIYVTSVAERVPLSSMVMRNFLVLSAVEEDKINSLSPSSTTCRSTEFSLAFFVVNFNTELFEPKKAYSRVSSDGLLAFCRYRR